MSTNGHTPSTASVPMRPADAFFWLAEAAAPEIRPLVAGLFLLDRRPDRARLRAAVERMTMRLPRLRQHVVMPAFALGMPVWKADAAFDLDYHLRDIVLPPPASWCQLLTFSGALFSVPLDHLRPLWEAHLIEGLGDGRAALFLKLHHAVMDGVGSIALFDALTDAHRGAALRVPHRTPVRRGVPPSPGARGAPARWNGTRTPAPAWSWTDPAAMVRGAARLARGTAGMLAEMVAAPPATRWLVDGDGLGRRFDAVSVSLTRLRRIKSALGVPLNDLVLAALAGALGRYHGRGRRPHELSCMVPMSLRVDDERGQLGNRVGGFTVRLPVDTPDPLARLARIRAQTAYAKSNGHGPAAQLFMQAAALVPAPLFRAIAQRVAGRVPVICSNVPGPPARRYLAGARIDAVYPFAPVMRGTPLTIALVSYGDTVGIGIDSDPSVIPDPERIGSELQRALDELERAARMRPAARGRMPRKAEAADRATLATGS